MRQATEPRTLIGLVERAAVLHEDRAALSVREGLRTRRWTYAELRGAARSASHWLRNNASLPAGSPVLVCAPNSPLTVAAHLGVMGAGLIAVPLDIGSSADFITGVAHKTGAKLLLGGGASPDVAGLRHIDFQALCSGASGGEPLTDAKPDDIAEIVFTSGTTGDPKGTMLSHANIIANVVAASEVVPADMPLRLLSILPLSHMLEQTVGLYLPLLKGGSVHYLSSLQPAVVLREMRRQQVTGLVAVPRLLDLMLRGIESGIRQRGMWPQWQRRRRLADRLPIDVRPALFRNLHRSLGGQLKFVLCGGAALPEDIARWWELIGVHVIQGYGSTECSPVIASTTYHERPPGSVGRPLRGVEVRTAEDNELLVRGANVARGYWRDDARSAAAFTQDGWFRTGDIGEISPDGTIRITGRLGERIVLASGQKVYPADIEGQLLKEPGVIDCAVVALPDAAGRDRIHASLRMQPGHGADAAATAVRSVNARLGSHQQVLAHTVWTAGDFPRTNLGKIKRGEIVATLLGQQQRSVAARQESEPAPESLAGQLLDILETVSGSQGSVSCSGKELNRDLGLDSLAQVELAAAIEERFGIAIDETQLSATKTVAQLQTLIEAGARAGRSQDFREWPLHRSSRLARGLLQPAILFPLHRALASKFEVERRETVTRLRGPMLLTANHSSHVDTLSVLRALPSHVRASTVVAAAEDYFYKNRFAGAAASLLLNSFPFSRAGNVRATLERCGELVDRGYSILIYPEGTRSPDGAVLPFKAGIGLLAQGLGIPVVPVAVVGGFAILRKGATWPQRGPVRVRFGQPLHFEAAADPADIARQLHDAVVNLLNERPNDA